MLTITYCAALLASVACWQRWRCSVNGILIGPFARRGLVCAYWLLSFTILGGLLASLRIQTDDLSQTQFTVLLVLAVGMMLQVALFALVVTPVVMRGRLK